MRTSSISKRNSGRWIASVGAALWVAAAAQAAEPANPEQVAAARALMEETATEVVAILKNGESTSSARRRELEKVAHARFDFRTMSRLVLRQHWKRLDPTQQDDFVAEFTDYLANDYGRRLDRYEDETVEVVEADPKGTRGDVVVGTVIRGGANDGAVVDYRMKPADEGWRIINVVVEGISLVHNFADQFREVINQGGPEALLAQLREKNAAARAEAEAGADA